MAFGMLVMAFTAAILGAAPVADASSAAPPSAIQAENGGYVLGVADKVKISVFDEPTLSGEFRVAADGNVAFPLLGSIKARGLTPPQLEASIADHLNPHYIKDPRVSVEVLTFRPYYILGEISRGGEYPFSSNLTVINAVATAGGFSYRANRGRVFIKRMGESVERPVRLTPTTRVEPGDTIRIGERYF